MPIIEMKCPRCGAPCDLQRGKTDEYVCSSCGGIFKFVDQTRRVLTTDVVIRSCLHCGKPIEVGKGFKCTRCGSEYFCDGCVDEIEGKYVCADCIIRSEENCLDCKKQAVYKCVQCGNRACKLHVYEDFTGEEVEFAKDGTRVTDYYVRYCPTCHSFVCRNCEKVVGIFFRNRTCPKCGTTLDLHEIYR